MSAALKTVNYPGCIEDSQEKIRELVLTSYQDIAAEKGRNCNKFFNELEKRYYNNPI